MPQQWTVAASSARHRKIRVAPLNTTFLTMTKLATDPKLYFSRSAIAETQLFGDG
jgi:hypothetical protein